MRKLQCTSLHHNKPVTVPHHDTLQITVSPPSLSLVPSAPPQEVSIVSTSSHSFTMTWAPPPKGQQNGEIMSYEVEYREEGSNSTVVSTTRGMRYTAEDLTTDRVYQFRVAANTVKVTGPFSEWIEVGTIPTGNECLRLHPHQCAFAPLPSLSSPHWRIIKTHVYTIA